jgi:hypothetical protein
MNLRRIISLITLVAVGVSAQAQVVFVAGEATGRFNSNSFTTDPNDEQSLFGLTYRGSTFSDFTAGGFVAFGGSPSNPNVDNFGSLSLDTVPQSYTGNTFTLRLAFSDPGNATGDFTSDIFGEVTSIGGGGVFVDFGGPQVFNWSGGSFIVNVTDTNINPGLVSSITGNVRAVPEPATMGALALGFGGLLAARRRKKA